MSTLKIREDRLRRAFGRAGYRLHKTPARSWLREHYGPGYMVTDDRNMVVLGCSSRQYDATITEVEAFETNVSRNVSHANLERQKPSRNPYKISEQPLIPKLPSKQ